uniref:CW-type domain-containing protein n=1 Tax=Noccaea caerulescens TaxID=107243 RepID=A0A1J3EYY8_NOCCA
MEESELEEGEACSYNITNDYSGSIDPDNDLSYIDEKVQNILGHFQKDFEGDFSADNLGAKFGGYGSFLPTYQRSPIWSHPKTPAKPQSSAGTRSPNILLGESQSGNAASSSVPKRAKSGLASSGIPKKSMKSKKPNSSSRQESATKKPGVFSKQNSLKLRIKMGSDSLSTEKNAAAIYSGLGLDVSPSLSLDNNSLSGSEEMNGEPQGYSPLDSPTSILNVMTSLPVDHSQLLSPLSDDLIRFLEREKPEPSRVCIESSSATANGLKPQKAGEKPSVEKKRKMVESYNFSAETNVLSKKGLLDGTDATVRERAETNTSYPTAAEKETASNKLFDTSKENNNGAVRGEMGSDVERRPWGLTRHIDHENPKTSSAGSVREDKKTRFGDDDASGYSRKVGKYKDKSGKASDSVKKVKSGHKAEPEHSSRKQKSDQLEQEPQSSSKFKEQKSSVVYETKMNGQIEKKEVVALKPQNDGKKTEDTYKDFFGDIEDSEEEEEQNYSLEVKDLPMSEKRLPALEDMPEKSSFPLAESQNVGPGPILSKLRSDPSLPKANPVIIQEHWVACDKCGKWRLLPFGVFPEDLPEKWMCTMLNWLPGVNYCNVPEDETTKALYAMYQIPAPETQAPMQSNLGGPKPQFNQGDDNTKKKKKGFKKIDNEMDKEVSRTAETNKKTIQTSSRNGIIQNSHGLSDSTDGDRQKHKQKEKEKGKAVDHHSDESRSLKVNNKRNADLDSSMLAKKMKIESFLFPDESEHGNGRPTSSSGVPAVSADKKPKPRVFSKMPKEEGGASDTGNSNSTGGSKKRKLKESHGSRVYSENKNHERKKARVLDEEKEPEKSEKENRSHSKREHGNVQNLIAATSSSSKISDSHKPRNSSHEAKCSPVESVSSSPMRISNPEKSVSARRKKEESYDGNVFAAGSLRRFSDGENEDDGGSDRSQTRAKDKHGSHESSVLDICDNKRSLKGKERAEPSLDANFENGGHKDLPRKLNHIHGEGKQSSDHHRRSNDSLAKKSGKSSSSRSKDKSQSIRSDSREGPRHNEKKIYDGSPDSRVDLVVRPNIPKPYDIERISERSSRADLASPSRPPSRGVQGDSSMLSSRKKVDKCGTSAGNNSIQADDVTKATGQIRRKNEPSPSPLRKEVTSAQAAQMLKEAKDLKHTADRLKSSVTNIEHTELYFQACLKFLHGAFLLEMSSTESARQGETMFQSMKIYTSTANLFGFCAHEYEKSKDVGAAALAYKCMEAAYMRVVNSSYTSANRYRNELQTSLQMVPSGESPSSSASDVDNVNHLAAADKVGISRGISSPLVAGNHVISAQNRSNLLRILQFAQDVNLAMDASRKSRVALAASIENLGEAQQEGEGILSIKSALDFNFQDIEGLVRLVKLAMKANNR